MNNAKSQSWQSILQLILSLLAAIGLLGASGLSLIFGVSRLIDTEVNGASELPIFMQAAGLMVGGILVLPSAWYAYRRLRSTDGKDIGPRMTLPTWLPSVLAIILIPAALLGGDWVRRNSDMDWLLLPGISLVVTGMPIAWLVWLGKRGLSAGSRQRQWGLLAGGLVFSPVIIIILELVAMIGLLITAGILVAINPELMQELSNLAAELEDPLTYAESMQEVLVRYIQQPVFMAGAFVYAAVLIPLIEEAFKPLGLWLLAGRRLTPSEGFVGGMICGAGFALFENSIALSTSGEDWALLAGIRISTALLHMVNTGVMGWALASAWTNNSYKWLGISYAYAVGIHGIWNALSIASFLLPQYNLSSAEPGVIEIYLGLTVIGLGVLTVINIFLLLGINRRLRKKADMLFANYHSQPETPLSLDEDII